MGPWAISRRSHENKPVPAQAYPEDVVVKRGNAVGRQQGEAGEVNIGQEDQRLEHRQAHVRSTRHHNARVDLPNKTGEEGREGEGIATYVTT